MGRWLVIVPGSVAGVGWIVSGGHDVGAAVRAVRPGPRSGDGFLGWGWTDGCWGQPGRGRRVIAARPVSSRSVHRWPAARCSTRRRVWRARRPATESSRSRSRFGFPPPSRVLGVGEHLGPGQQLTSEHDDRAPDAVLVQPVQRQVVQPGVLGVADAILAAGPATVPQLEVGDLSTRSAGAGVGGSQEGCGRGDPVAVVVGDPQLRSGMRAFDAGDDPHPRRPGGEVEQAGELGDPCSVPDPAGAVERGRPGLLRDLLEEVGGVVGQPEPHRVGQPPGGEPVQEFVGRTRRRRCGSAPTAPTGARSWCRRAAGAAPSAGR